MARGRFTSAGELLPGVVETMDMIVPGDTIIPSPKVQNERGPRESQLPVCLTPLGSGSYHHCREQSLERPNKPSIGIMGELTLQRTPGLTLTPPSGI